MSPTRLFCVRINLEVISMEIQVNGVTLYYEVVGKGPKPFIFIHGNGEDHKTFSGIEKYLGDRYTLYLVDSRGHGQSSNLDEITYGDIAEDLISFIKSLNLKKPHIFGYSDGGNVALIAAIDFRYSKRRNRYSRNS